MKETMTPGNSRCMLRISIADMVSLGVRTRGLKKPELPETLYQHLPMIGMALMATLPNGDFSVSIPGACGGRPGYPILETPSLSADGFVIVYGRTTNGWYEAGHTLYRGAAYAIEEFVLVAKQWIEQHCGSLTAIKDRYAYAIPSLDEWEAIQRDSGYMAWDASAMPQEILPEWPATLKSPHSSGIVARIPVFKGEGLLSKGLESPRLAGEINEYRCVDAVSPLQGSSNRGSTPQGSRPGLYCSASSRLEIPSRAAAKQISPGRKPWGRSHERKALQGRSNRSCSGDIALIPPLQNEDCLVPVFSQVEVMSDPDSPGVWIGFDEFKRERILRSRLPDTILPDFREWLGRLTEESGFDHWIFYPGMLFGDCMEWWGDGRLRRTIHEGIDFAKGFRCGKGVGAIAAEIPVHSITDGEVAAILDDFIGKSVVVRHSGITRENGDIFHTLLSHIQPEVSKLQSVAKGQVVGRVGRSTGTTAPIHLHLTGAWVPKGLAVDEVGLNLIHPAYSPVSLADFNSALQNNPLCRFEILPGN